MLRLFVAIDFPDNVITQIANICHSVRGARWAPLEQLHLTLKFIGEADEELYHDISEALEHITFSSLRLRLKGTGCFPPRKPPRILWVGVEPSPMLGELASAVESTLAPLGIERERRKFHPHVTVARLRDNVRPSDITPFLSGTGLFKTEEFNVSQFCLYSSILRPEGAIHRREHTYPLH
jgi:2'-5' RNA ligase